MKENSQDYAGLAENSYSNEYRSGRYPVGSEPRFEYEGVVYKVVEHSSNSRSGYEGTVYQRLDTGEVIVAHRGTESQDGVSTFLKDGIADANMLLSRMNPQTVDAIALTQRALEYANREGNKPGGRTPEVTVTGHSLGGTLAQIAAHYFGLRGETFNAYGAVSLGLRIGEGGDSVINHVMAGDPVSAASPHFGQVRVYATQQEIGRLLVAGYANEGNPLEPRAAGAAPFMLTGSHGMHHFLDMDESGKPDRSILSDPAAREMARMFDPMIDKYRNDIAVMRGAVTLASRGLALEVARVMQDPLAPGAPAERAERDERAAAIQTQRGADYLEKRDAFFRERLPAIDPVSPPPVLLRPREGREPHPGYFEAVPGPQAAPAVPDIQWTERMGQGPSASTPGSLQSDRLQTFPTDHPRYPLYAALQERLPGVSTEKLAEVTHHAALGGITDPRQIRDVIVHNDGIWVAGRIPGDRANVALSEASPALPDTLREMASFDRQHAAQFQEQQRYLGQQPGAPGHA